MSERHTIPVTVTVGDRECQINLIVDATWYRGFAQTRVDPGEPAGYNVWNVQLGAHDDDLNDALAELLNDDAEMRKYEAMEARADALREERLLERQV